MAYRAACFALFVSSLFAVGCDCSGTELPPGTEGAPCGSSAECNAGLMCRDGVCARALDGGPDVRTDGGDPPFTDAGPACPAVQRCGSSCCAVEEECAEGVCRAMCPSGLRCGPSEACCGDGELCIDDACVAPGGPCEEEIDCGLEERCEPSLMRCLPRAASGCEYFPPPGVFTPTEQWAWETSTIRPENVHVMMTPVVGDLDGDGTPEVVFNTYNATSSYGADGVLRVVRGDTGAEVRSVADPVICPMAGIALGDLDGDGTPEIVTALAPCGASPIAALALDGTVVWTSTDTRTVPEGVPFVMPAGFGAPSIADLEGDGQAEVIFGGVVFESDGRVRFANNPNAGANYPSSPLSTVYDMDGDGDLEIVGGNAVWHHDGTPLWENAALVDGYVAVADFFADGVPDIAVVHIDAAGAGHVSIRRGTDGTVLFGPILQPGGGRGGPPTIADFDGDGLPEIAVAGAAAYAVFNPDYDVATETPVLWSRTTQDTSSNITGSSVFDFDGDGSAEVVYNDECYMRVYSGVDGTVLAEVAQNSHTLIEYPLIVDVDADGNAEIVFAANAAVNRCSAIAGWDGLRAGIRVFRDASDNWVGTRPVWNQHAYSITNVRHDLSIPTDVQPNWQRFNNFRQNSQSFDAPNLVPIEPGSTETGCPTTLVLTATIRNAGAASVGAGLAVSFYAGTPDAPGALLGTARTTAPIPPGGSLDVSLSISAPPTGRDLPFFVRADDVGDGSGEHNECLEDDNVVAGTYSCVSIE